MNVSLNIFRNFVAQLSKFGFGMANWRVAINSKFTWTCLKFAFSLFVLPLFALNLCTGSTLMCFSMPTLSFKISVTFSAHISRVFDVVTQALLATGAQVFLLSHQWLENNLPEAKVFEVEELLDPCDRLRVQWGNHTEMSLFGGLK